MLTVTEIHLWLEAGYNRGQHENMLTPTETGSEQQFPVLKSSVLSNHPSNPTSNADFVETSAD